MSVNVLLFFSERV